MINGRRVTYDGSTSWFKEGKLHREDGPAIEWHDGGKSWFINGEEHREDGPAIEYSDGTTEWYLEGKLVYSDRFGVVDKTSEFELSDKMKRGLIKYKLGKLS